MTTAETLADASRQPSAASRRRGRAQRNLRTIGMVWRRELIRFRRSPARVITGLAQPLLLLFVLGGGLSPLVNDETVTGGDFQEFLLPGVVAMSVIFSSTFAAISIVWDREFGFLREMLVAPVSRTALVLGKATGGASVAVGQALLLLAAAPVVGVSLTPGEVAQMILLLLLLAIALTAFGIVAASRIQRIESFQVMMTLIVQPMFFLSGAIFPLQGLPGWLNVATRLNPATYGVDPIRRVALGDRGALTIGGEVVPIWAEAAVLVALATVLLALAVRSFRHAD